MALDISSTIEALRLIGAGGIGAAIASGIMTWIEKLVIQKKLDAQKAEYEKQLEELKAQFLQKHTVHKLQFEKEFQIYESLWVELVELRKIIIISPIIDRFSEDANPLDVYKKRWKKAVSKFEAVSAIFNNQKPFFYRPVSEQVDKLLKECRNHLIVFNNEVLTSRERKPEPDVYLEVEKFRDKVENVIDKIEQIIQERIGLLQEVKLVD